MAPGHQAACHFAEPFPIPMEKAETTILDDAAAEAVLGEA